ncbi:unnamed protein product [Amoebophrya sp. A25]|nr:unnamed protein product [Amoebophrya sp. A25]|eukprot:GSA25T00013933001.1
MMTFTTHFHHPSSTELSYTNMAAPSHESGASSPSTEEDISNLSAFLRQIQKRNAVVVDCFVLISECGDVFSSDEKLTERIKLEEEGRGLMQLKETAGAATPSTENPSPASSNDVDAKRIDALSLDATMFMGGMESGSVNSDNSDMGAHLSAACFMGRGQAEASGITGEFGGAHDDVGEECSAAIVNLMKHQSASMMDAEPAQNTDFDAILKNKVSEMKSSSSAARDPPKSLVAELVPSSVAQSRKEVYRTWDDLFFRGSGIQTARIGDDEFVVEKREEVGERVLVHMKRSRNCDAMVREVLDLDEEQMLTAIAQTTQIEPFLVVDSTRKHVLIAKAIEKRYASFVAQLVEGVADFLIDSDI